jgi:glycosyltransferase involved in cell wall biosynthesis
VKVALVCDWYHPRVGGIELQLQDLGTHLMAAGHEVVVVTPTPGDDVVNGIRVRRIDTPRAPVFDFLYTPAGVRAVGDALSAERVDVAHCHVSIISPAALGGAVQAQHRRIPTVVTFHSVVPQTHLLARATRLALGTSRWRARFSAVSKRVARDVRAIAGRQPITVIPNGVDVAFWRATPRRQPDGTLRLVTVGRLNAKKRMLTLVDMMTRLVTLLGEDQHIVLRIIGDGPQRGILERAIARAALGDNIELLRTRPRQEIRDVFSQSDIFVLPAVRESFGLAALEARCAGLPVVAMAASAVSELIDHGREGLLASSDAELADHVAALARDLDLRSLIAWHNRDTVPPCDWADVTERNVELYRDAIALRVSV